ncbi:TauD/TfdA dioxygenase family protein [Aquicoccus sp. G2-2]|uniref:TauD/TfdA dioxygenase family protein n=1 Tax=Aquicoccus sp. G2-2 TaxID=3092120 RepID=UPI002AE023EE|nr:TauD/TfdA family dioxygenase [Aquicoccus sp. G2-2]MEA1114823.1 TauD/TfdA family dioxygenase [Aquicoccus sp. G2-2]
MSEQPRESVSDLPSVQRINPNIGAEIGNIDLHHAMSDAQFDVVHGALTEHEVIVLKKQDITTEEFMAFGERFGELSVHPFSPNMEEKPAVIVLDNHGKNPPRLTDVWHSDETFRDAPPMGTILRCRIAPEIGGDTMFSSMTCAYEGLSDRLQQLIYGLEAVHDFKPFRTLFGNSPEDRQKLRKIEDEFPNPTHPVVRVHSVTGRKIINVNPQFTTRIVGMSPAESDAVLQLLFDQAKLPEYQLRVRWEPDQIVFWDNRSVHHYAVHDYFPQRRRMERVTITGDKPFGVEPDSYEATAPRSKALRSEGLKRVEADVPARNFERA